jgi:uroporphyrinogen decarboxylase
LVELLTDQEVIQAITETYLGRAWVPVDTEDQETYWKQIIAFYYRLGFDFVPVACDWTNDPVIDWQETDDVAELSRGKRSWANEGVGPLTTWEAFERFPWDDLQPDWSRFEIVARHLPAGMKIVVYTSFFETVLESWMGFQGLYFVILEEARCW